MIDQPTYEALLAEVKRLRAENAELKKRLGIPDAPPKRQLSGHERIALFMSLFSGRQDVYGHRWEIKMERSRSKSETGAVHLERNDFILSKQKREAVEAERKQKDAEKKQAMAESRAEHAAKNCQIAEMFRDMARMTVDKLNQDIDTKRKSANDLDALIAEKRNEAMKSGESLAIEELKQRLNWRDNLIDNIGAFLYKTLELFRKAIDVIVAFATSCYNVLDGDEAETIKTAIDVLSVNVKGRMPVVNFMLITVDHNAALNNEQFRKAQREVTDVANGRYDSKINRSSIHR